MVQTSNGHAGVEAVEPPGPLTASWVTTTARLAPRRHQARQLVASRRPDRGPGRSARPGRRRAARRPAPHSARPARPRRRRPSAPRSGPSHRSTTRVGHLIGMRARPRRWCRPPPRRRGGARAASSATSAAAGSSPRSGRPAPSPTRAASVSGRARSQTTVPLARSRARFSGLSTAPPATETTTGAALGAGRRRAGGLGLPEGRLAVAGEQLGDGQAGRRLHVGVGVEVLPTEPFGQQRPAVVLPAPIMPTSRMRASSAPRCRSAARTGRRSPADGRRARARRRSRRGCARARPTSPAELAQRLSGQHERRHRLGDDAHGRHRRHVGALPEADGRLLGHDVDGLEDGPVERGQWLHGHAGRRAGRRWRCRPRCRRHGRSAARSPTSGS